MPCLCSCALHCIHVWNGLGWLLFPNSHTSFRPKQWVPCMGCEGMRPDTSGQLLNPSFIWLQNLEPLSMIGISIMSMTWPLCLLSKNILLWQPELPKQDLALCGFTWGGGRKTCQLHSLTEAEVSVNHTAWNKQPWVRGVRHDLSTTDQDPLIQSCASVEVSTEQSLENKRDLVCIQTKWSSKVRADLLGARTQTPGCYREMRRKAFSWDWYKIIARATLWLHPI